MGGPGSGPQKGALGILADVNQRIDAKMPKLIDKLADRALEGDIQAATYLIDRRLGKPKQQVDQTTTINITVTGGEILRQIRQVEQDSNAILEQREPVLMAEYCEIEEDSDVS